jgi:hypothetical protein
MLCCDTSTTILGLWLQQATQRLVRNITTTAVQQRPHLLQQIYSKIMLKLMLSARSTQVDFAPKQHKADAAVVGNAKEQQLVVVHICSRCFSR